jgi:hypothetical protein
MVDLSAVCSIVPSWIMVYSMRQKTFPISCGFVSENGNYRSIRLTFLTAVPFRFV